MARQEGATVAIAVAHEFEEIFGFGARDEDAGTDLEVDVTKPGPSGQMLEGHPGCARLDHPLEDGQLLGHRARGDRDKRARHTRNVAQQDLSVVARRLHSPGFKRRDGLVEQQLRVHWSTFARRSAMSASTSEAMTSSSAPSMTWSRL